MAAFAPVKALACLYQHSTFFFASIWPAGKQGACNPILETMIANEKNSAQKAQLHEYLNDASHTQITLNTSN